MTIKQIERNLLIINQNIVKTCKTYELNPKNVNLVAVCKKFPVESIIEAINANCKIFAENYINEAFEKWPEIKKLHPEVKLHFIGGLQGNKAAKALELFDCIESLDSEKLALEFQKQIKKHGNRYNPEFFVQVNIGSEEQKSGIDPLLTKEFVDFAKNECGLNVTGLMCIPPADENPSLYFALLAKIAKECNLTNLSMGMSADYEQAIAIGANYIRIGTGIFGARDV